MKIHLRYYGVIGEQVGCESETVEIQPAYSIADLDAFLKQRYPSLGNLDYQVSYNHKMSGRETLLEAEAVVALLPPFAGG